MNSPYYQPSGKVPRSAIVVALIWGLAILPVAFLYAWLSVNTPPPVIPCALLVFAGGIALVVRWAARSARVRSRAWITGFAAGLAMFAWYSHWAAFIALSTQGQQGGAVLTHAFNLACDPAALLAGVVYVARHDPWVVGTIPMVAMWLMEGFVLVCLAALPGQEQTAQPYCEACDGWAWDREVPRKFAVVADTAAMTVTLEAAPYLLVPMLAPLTGSTGTNHTTVTLHYCRCGDTYVSLASHVVTGRDEDDGFIYSKQTWLTALRVPGTDSDTLQGKLAARADGVPDEDMPVPPELAGALIMLQAARRRDAFMRALPHVASPRRQVRVDANRLCAFSHMHEQRWERALAHWHAVWTDEATARIALQLACCTVMAGDLRGGQAWLARAQALSAASGELAQTDMQAAWTAALDAQLCASGVPRHDIS